MDFLSELAARRRFGMRPGLETIRATLSALGNPERSFSAVHIAGTNGKGAVSAMLATCLNKTHCVGRYTSPHLVRLNERFFLDGRPIDDATLERAAARVAAVAPDTLTFFEALTAVAMLVYAERSVELAVLECGLGGRLDATNVCRPLLTVITRVGLDHCDWLGSTLRAIATEKAGIIKPGVPLVLGKNDDEVREVVAARAREAGAPFFYAPELSSEAEIPTNFPLQGVFNRENAVTALAALKVLGKGDLKGLGEVVWPGRFQKVGNFLLDGAHNPPAMQALVNSLPPGKVELIAGFCSDKDVDECLRIIAGKVNRAIAVKTTNPRSLNPVDLALKMQNSGIAAEAGDTLASALKRFDGERPILICGSLFLVGEALVLLNAYPWGEGRFDPSEQLRAAMVDGRC